MISRDDAEEVIKNFSFQGGLSLWKPEMRIHAWNPDWNFFLEVRIQVPRVRDGRVGEVIFTLDIPLYGMGRDTLPPSIMRRLRDVIDHELKESVLYQGEHLEDPHPRGPNQL